MTLAKKKSQLTFFQNCLPGTYLKRLVMLSHFQGMECTACAELQSSVISHGH